MYIEQCCKIVTQGKCAYSFFVDSVGFLGALPKEYKRFKNKEPLVTSPGWSAAARSALWTPGPSGSHDNYTCSVTGYRLQDTSYTGYRLGGRQWPYICKARGWTCERDFCSVVSNSKHLWIPELPAETQMWGWGWGWSGGWGPGWWSGCGWRLLDMQLQCVQFWYSLKKCKRMTERRQVLLSKEDHVMTLECFKVDKFHVLRCFKKKIMFPVSKY